ncbi:MAG: hypothetical protein GZ091_18510 [Paludibacter sp.]|nr:hypothetical protein [Paludibacter sp.]
MKIKLTKSILSVLAITFALTACDKVENEISAKVQISKSDLIETDYFSENYIYSDTLRLYTENNNYVDIVVSSDNKDVLDSHLKMNSYEVNENSYSENLNRKVNIQNYVQNEKTDNIVGFENIDIRNLKKISIEVLGSSEKINGFDMKCKRNINDLSESKIQKVPFTPTLWYYEYTSGVHEGYGQLKYTNDADVFGTSQPTRVRYGSKSCWLCSWKTWPDGVYATLNSWDSGYLYSYNTFGYDGYNCQGNIYKLCTGVLTYSPYNHWTRFEKTPFEANW